MAKLRFKSWHRKIAEKISDPINNAILGEDFMANFRFKIDERKRKKKEMPF